MPEGILIAVAVKAIEIGSWVVSSVVWADMLAARYMSALNALRDSSCCCYLAGVPGKNVAF